jgi:hypothetical protein
MMDKEGSGYVVYEQFEQFFMSKVNSQSMH